MQKVSYYQAEPFSGLVKHHRAGVSLVRDGVDKVWWEQERQLQIAMQVRSGDYFVTIATKLDEISQMVKKGDRASADDLELLVSDLLYLQRNYDIKKRS